MNRKQKSLGNKGFSLVELIIVIAIMAVLVGVLAPQFIKYVGQSSRATDVQNAQSIATAYLTDIADGTRTTDIGTAATPIAMEAPDATGTGGNLPSSLSELPKVKGSLDANAVESHAAVDSGSAFKVFVDVSEGTVFVYAGDYELYPGADATAYKDGH